MKLKRYVGCLSLLFTLFLSSVTIAQEMNACADEGAGLNLKVYEVLANVELSAIDVAATRQLLAGCVARYPYLSSRKRNEFLHLLSTLIARMNEGYLKVSSEGFYRPDGPTRASQLRAQRLDEIRQDMQAHYIALLNRRSPLDQGWSGEFVSNLYLGYETTDLDGFDRHGNGRFGINYYHQIDGSLDSKEGWGKHIFGDAVLTNSAEHSVTSFDKTYEVDLNFYLPNAEDGDIPVRWGLGPVVGIKMKKLSGISTSRWKYMAGLRLARSPDLYIDGRYGKSEGVPGQRIEIRGQMPVASLYNGDVIVGGTLNLSTDDGASVGDSIQMYLLWQVNIIDVFNVY